MCSPGYHHNGFAATHALGHMMYELPQSAWVHEFECMSAWVPQSHCGDNREGTLFSWLHIYIYIWTRNQCVYVLQNNSKTKNTTFVWRIFVYMYTEGVFEVAVESWPEWDLNPRPLNTESLSDALTDGAIRPWVQLALRANFVQVLQFHLLFSVLFHFGYCLLQSPRLFELKVFWGNHMSVAAWVDTYGIHHWRIL